MFTPRPIYNTTPFYREKLQKLTKYKQKHNFNCEITMYNKFSDEFGHKKHDFHCFFYTSGWPISWQTDDFYWTDS